VATISIGSAVLVGQDQAVGGPGEHVDADAAEQDALGFGHELVAGADEDVGLGQPNRPKVIAATPWTPPMARILSAPQMWRCRRWRVDADAGTRRRAGTMMCRSLPPWRWSPS
jgi:hypothetical protein